ncbi:hypothetical protein AAX09_00160 [Moraxella bovoculi]|uniref:DUF2939 domain-containing protein n=1 Tax=Moraxella bovoculi TaxID=386891 RepID=UPI0006249D17|nr:DUF2939 domain-containing protein [Moraxella bovoculi]AKG18091.1 hypothetical protein AAX09_00160 [Moraxella bovoculi]NSM11237.1 DUF2939 domain-containing protein [Moraxella bovoculi]
MKTALKISLFLLVIVLIIAGVSPYYRLYQLNQAYERGDYLPIVQAVDFDTLRSNLKTQLYTKADNLAQEVPKELEFLGINQEKLNNLAKIMIDGSIDNVITYDNAIRLSKGEIQATDASIADLVVLGDAWQSLDDSEPNQATDVDQNNDKNHQLSYCGINRFSVKTSAQGKNVDVRLSRHGLTQWKIDNVILP